MVWLGARPRPVECGLRLCRLRAGHRRSPASGFVASLWHLGNPQRAWRALSQWRSSWLSREGVLAVATLWRSSAFTRCSGWLGTGPLLCRSASRGAARAGDGLCDLDDLCRHQSGAALVEIADAASVPRLCGSRRRARPFSRRALPFGARRARRCSAAPAASYRRGGHRADVDGRAPPPSVLMRTARRRRPPSALPNLRAGAAVRGAAHLAELSDARKWFSASGASMRTNFACSLSAGIHRAAPVLGIEARCRPGRRLVACITGTSGWRGGVALALFRRGRTCRLTLLRVSMRGPPETKDQS